MQAKSKNLLTGLLVTSLLILTGLLSPLFASNYGEGTYGGGSYNIGSSASQSQQQGSSQGTSGYSSPANPGCTANRPIGQADLFQIDRTGQTAKLHFTPVNDYTTGYHVVFGYSEGDERFGGISMPIMNENDGVQSMVVDHLNPKHLYFFKVIPTNGCATGEWSNWLKADRVTGRNSIFYRYLPEIVRRALY